jgi:hypothetical protein
MAVAALNHESRVASRGPHYKPVTVSLSTSISRRLVGQLYYLLRVERAAARTEEATCVAVWF